MHVTFANCLTAFLSMNCTFGAVLYLGLFEVGTWNYYFQFALGTIFISERDPVL